MCMEKRGGLGGCPLEVVSVCQIPSVGKKGSAHGPRASILEGQAELQPPQPSWLMVTRSRCPPSRHSCSNTFLEATQHGCGWSPSCLHLLLPQQTEESLPCPAPFLAHELHRERKPRGTRGILSAGFLQIPKSQQARALRA